MSSNEEAAVEVTAGVPQPAARASKSGFWASVKESLRGSEQDFTEGSLNRAVGLLAVPMVIEMIGESTFAVTDAFFVARLGPDALAAVGLTESLLEIIYAVAVGLSMATTAMVARRVGEKDEKGAARAAVQAIVIGLGMATVVGAAGALFAPQLLSLMGASPETVARGASYPRVMYGGMVTVVIDGTKTLRSVRLDPAVVSRDDVEMLQDLILAAVNDAQRKIDEQLERSMSGLMGGLKLPGLF